MRNSLRYQIPKKVAARGMPAAQAGIAVTAPPSRHPTVTDYKYEEIAEIICKVGGMFLRRVFKGLQGEWSGEGLTMAAAGLAGLAGWWEGGPFEWE
jgi:hypothetical protein